MEQRWRSQPTLFVPGMELPIPQCPACNTKMSAVGTEGSFRKKLLKKGIQEAKELVKGSPKFAWLCKECHNVLIQDQIIIGPASAMKKAGLV